MRIVLRQAIDRPAEAVWEELADLHSHPEWMNDAENLEFTTSKTSGVGTTMRVVTKVGPFRTTDVLEVTEWSENSHIRIRHAGVVEGEGVFRLQPQGPATTVIWEETLEFPWWVGGGLTALAAKPVLRRIWKGNLERLADRVTGP